MSTIDLLALLEPSLATTETNIAGFYDSPCDDLFLGWRRYLSKYRILLDLDFMKLVADSDHQILLQHASEVAAGMFSWRAIYPKLAINQKFYDSICTILYNVLHSRSSYNQYKHDLDESSDTESAETASYEVAKVVHPSKRARSEKADDEESEVDSDHATMDVDQLEQSPPPQPKPSKQKSVKRNKTGLGKTTHKFVGPQKFPAAVPASKRPAFDPDHGYYRTKRNQLHPPARDSATSNKTYQGHVAAPPGPDRLDQCYSISNTKAKPLMFYHNVEETGPTLTKEGFAHPSVPIGGYKPNPVSIVDKLPPSLVVNGRLVDGAFWNQEQNVKIALLYSQNVIQSLPKMILPTKTIVQTVNASTNLVEAAKPATAASFINGAQDAVLMSQFALSELVSLVGEIRREESLYTGFAAHVKTMKVGIDAKEAQLVLALAKLCARFGYAHIQTKAYRGYHDHLVFIIDNLDLHMEKFGIVIPKDADPEAPGISGAQYISPPLKNFPQSYDIALDLERQAPIYPLAAADSVSLKSTDPTFCGLRSKEKFRELATHTSTRDAVLSLSFSLDGRFLVIAGFDGVAIYDMFSTPPSAPMATPHISVNNPDVKPVFTTSQWMLCERESRHLLITGSSNGDLYLWEWRDDHQLFETFNKVPSTIAQDGQVSDGEIISLDVYKAYVPDGRHGRVAASFASRIVKVWSVSLTSKEVTMVFRVSMEETFILATVKFRKDLDLFVFKARNGVIRLLDQRTGETIHTDLVKGDFLGDVCIDEDRNAFLIFDGGISLNHLPRQAKFMGDGIFVLAGSESGAVFLYDTESGSVIQTLAYNKCHVRTVVVSEFSKYRLLATAGSAPAEVNKIKVYYKPLPTASTPNSTAGSSTVVNADTWTIPVKPSYTWFILMQLLWIFTLLGLYALYNLLVPKVVREWVQLLCHMNVAIYCAIYRN
ncbi:hypothetical protein D9758_015921 [Tetrapyrgos nigripes]|uniref:Uncharacterized protein n=1 Tax=Tetrapyrgos nigripes TaxID=182062 RepID=A0A8H5CL86_9AGAR|nr:hypothetical protein D9758_015921 [Tetrapyrgos nigripes]